MSNLAYRFGQRLGALLSSMEVLNTVTSRHFGLIAFNVILTAIIVISYLWSRT